MGVEKAMVQMVGLDGCPIGWALQTTTAKAAGAPTKIHNAIAAPADGTPISTGGMMVGVVQTVATGSATMYVEGSLDGSNWVELRLVDVTSGDDAGYASNSGAWRFLIAGIPWIRLHVTAVGDALSVYFFGI